MGELENASETGTSFAGKRKSSEKGDVEDMPPKDSAQKRKTLTKTCVHEVAVPSGYASTKDELLYGTLSNPAYNGEMAKTYPFELEPFQSVSVACLERNESVLVSAHTSAGKTIAMSFRDKKRVIYTSPLKALSNQKYRELQQEFQDVGLMTGNVTLSPNANCLVMTTEILKGMLYRGSEILKEVAWVIFDEIHYMKDRERGIVWEESIVFLPKMVFLSAMMSNATEFAEWICHLHKQPCHVVYTDFRPTPLQHYVFPIGGSGLYLVVDEDEKFREDNFMKLQDTFVKQKVGERNKNSNEKASGRIDKHGNPGGVSDVFKIVKDNMGGSTSDLPYNVSDDDDGDDSDDYMDEYLSEDDYTTYQSQFDNVDLPTGVEAAVPWFVDAASLTSASNTTVLDGKGEASLPDLAENTERVTFASASSSPVPAQPIHESDKKTEAKDAMGRYKNFKLFDVVEDISDHHYSTVQFCGHKSLPTWAKQIQDEWNILEKNLPSTIFVRVCETRMDLLRAVIVGPSRTPYHDGLFVFDCVFPPTYPQVPPKVFYYSGGLRLNPNLYASGKVCLSLLGTYSGRQENENWIPSKSTMLQVLVSIQALILNEEPVYNEPGFDDESFKGERGKKMSDKYSEEVFIMSLKAMMYTMRRPPKHFEDLVLGHFRERASDILVACRAYADDGAKVGSFEVVDGVAPLDGVDKSASAEFRSNIKKIINILIKSFTQFCSIECEQFRVTD